LSRFRLALADDQMEPSVERGKDSSTRWLRVFVVVVLAGIVIGYVASVSYAQYPYEVGVNGNFTSSNGGAALYMAVPGCDAWLYQQCPDPGEYAVYQCWAPTAMNMSDYCVTYSLETSRGHYEEEFRNGENYVVTGYLVSKNGTFDKACDATVVLAPAITHHNATENLTC
jgi:hypothetical protein